MTPGPFSCYGVAMANEDIDREIYDEYMYHTRPPMFGGMTHSQAKAVLRAEWGLGSEEFDALIERETDRAASC